MPRHSVHRDVHDEKLREKACGPTALKIVLDYFGLPGPDIEELINLCLGKGAYSQRMGWRHTGLAYIARRYDLGAAVLTWGHLHSEAILKNLEQALRRGPCLALIRPKEPSGARSRFVVVKKMTKSKAHIILHDPTARSRRKVYRRPRTSDFMEQWEDFKVIAMKNLSSAI